MNLQSLARNLRIYFRIEMIMAEARLKFMARKAGLMALALALAVFGLALLNVGLFAFLLPIWGPVWTPVGLGGINLLLALVAVILAAVAKPGAELELAEDMRKVTASAIERDLTSGAAGLGALGTYLEGGRTLSLVVPALSAIIGALRKKKNA